MAENNQNNEQYDGDYRVALADKGRISFNLNWKWAVSIVGAILGFVMYLLIDKYHTQPMAELKRENIELRSELSKMKENNGKAINTLTNNQGILLDRSERTQSFIDTWFNENGKPLSTEIQPLDHNLPGN